MIQDQLKARWQQLLEAYQSTRVRGSAERHDLECALDAAECAMLDNPPVGCRRGLVLPGEMERPRNVPELATLTIEDAGIDVLTEAEVRDILASRDRTPPKDYVKFRLNQGSVGSCAGEAAAGVAATRVAQDGLPSVALNGYALYHYTSGGVDRGSTLHDNLAVLQEYGCPSEAVRPRSRGWRAPWTQAEFEDAEKYQVALDGVIRLRNWAEFATCLSKSVFAVYFGYTGHAIFASDLLDYTRLVYENSWGSSWGDNGRGTLSRDRVYWGYGVYCVIAMRRA